MASMMHEVSHHNIASAALTPLKSGAMEALGVNDATRELAHSITSMGNDMNTALEASQCIDDFTNASDFDITGHIPVVTIAISSFREYQLLTEDKNGLYYFIEKYSVGCRRSRCWCNCRS